MSFIHRSSEHTTSIEVSGWEIVIVARDGDGPVGGNNLPRERKQPTYIGVISYNPAPVDR